MRRILSLWLPEFATDRLTRDRPGMPAGPALADWRERPFATIAAGRGGVRIAAANAAARTQGIAPGLALADARALVPDLKTVAATPAEDTRALDALVGWCERYTPWAAAEGLSGDGEAGAWLDITGCAHLLGGEAALATDLATRLERIGFAARAGIADTAGAAWAAARFLTGAAASSDSASAGGRAAIIPEGAARQWLPALPLAALRLPAATLASLHRLGLMRVGDAAIQPRAPLVARFGALIASRLDQAMGSVDEPISPRRPPPSLRARFAFAEPIGRTEDIAAALDHLLAEVCRLLAEAGLGARRLDLAAFRMDGTVGRAAIGTGRPARQPGHLARLFAERLKALDPGFGIEVMTLAATVCEPLAAEQTTLAQSDRIAAQRIGAKEQLSLLCDRLIQRLGAAAVVTPGARQSHLPERSVTAAAPLDPALPASWPWRRRPVRLLRRPAPVTVEEDARGDGTPLALAWREGCTRLVRAEGPERIAPEWWHAGDGMARDYWRVEDERGRRLWLFRTGSPAGRWFVHGLLG